MGTISEMRKDLLNKQEVFFPFNESVRVNHDVISAKKSQQKNIKEIHNKVKLIFTIKERNLCVMGSVRTKMYTTGFCSNHDLINKSTFYKQNGLGGKKKVIWRQIYKRCFLNVMLSLGKEMNDLGRKVVDFYTQSHKKYRVGLSIRYWFHELLQKRLILY